MTKLQSPFKKECWYVNVADYVFLGPVKRSNRTGSFVLSLNMQYLKVSSEEQRKVQWSLSVRMSRFGPTHTGTVNSNPVHIIFVQFSSRSIDEFCSGIVHHINKNTGQLRLMVVTTTNQQREIYTSQTGWPLQYCP
jgi:hypothetical protein